MAYLPTPIKSVQSGTVVINPASGFTIGSTTISAVDLSASVLMHIGTSFTLGGPGIPSSAAFAYVVFDSNTQISGHRVYGGGEMFVGFTVIEFIKGFVKSLQRGIITTSGASATYRLSPTVNVAKSIVFHAGNTNDDLTSGSGDRWVTRLEITNSSTLTCYNGTLYNTQNTSWTVIEFK